jgi:hypothetical protein
MMLTELIPSNLHHGRGTHSNVSCAITEVRDTHTQHEQLDSDDFIKVNIEEGLGTCVSAVIHIPSRTLQSTVNNSMVSYMYMSSSTDLDTISAHSSLLMGRYSC